MDRAVQSIDSGIAELEIAIELIARGALGGRPLIDAVRGLREDCALLLEYAHREDLDAARIESLRELDQRLRVIAPLEGGAHGG